VEVREMLEVYGYSDENLPMICGSAQKALYEEIESESGSLSILKLLESVDFYIKQPERPVNESFLMAVEDVLSITGRGTVLTGKIETGRIKVNDEVELIGIKKYTTTCIGLEIFRKILEMAEAGENVGVLVRGINRHDIKRGFVIAHPKTFEARDKFEAKAYILTKEEGGRHKPFFNKFKPQFFFRTSNITGSIELFDEEGVVLPGDTVIFRVLLLEKVVLNINLRFAIREGTLTIGAGVITKVL
jgi:elongation factor Tu